MRSISQHKETLAPGLYVVSDQHLLAFNAASGRLRQIIDAIPGGSDLVLNGDTFDFERKSLHAWRGISENDRRYMDSLVAAKARGVRITILPGNHDDPLNKIEGETRFGIAYAETKEFMMADGRKGVILHGDQFQPDMPHLTSAARRLGGLTKPFVALGAHIDNTFSVAATMAESAMYAATGRGFNLSAVWGKAWPVLNGQRAAFERDTVEFALDHGYDIVVTGHTHDGYHKTIKKGSLLGSFRQAGAKLPRLVTRDVEFLNEGDGVAAYTFARIDVANSRCGMHHFSELPPANPDTWKINKALHRAESDEIFEDLHRACLGVSSNDNGWQLLRRVRRGIRALKP